LAKAARFLLYCLLIWAPLPLGSNRPIFWFVNGVAISAILLLFVAGEVAQKHRSNLAWGPLAWILSALTIWVVWMAVQVWPDMPPALRHPIWATLGGATDNVPNTISINPSATWTTIAQVVPGILLTVVAARLGSRRSRARFLLNVIIATTVGVAIYGIAAEYFGFRQIFLVDTDAYQGFLTGTFVGRNATATYLVIGMAGAAAMVLAALEDQFRQLRSAARRPIDIPELFRKSYLHFAAFMILAVALLNTGSRGGALAGITAILSVAILSAGGGRQTRPAIHRLAAVGLVGLFAIFVLFSSVTFNRIGINAWEWEVGRMAVYQDTIDMIASRPLLGQGAGTFVDAFPAFHSRALSGVVWNAAHNTYLQMAAELGLPIFGIVIACFGGVLIYLIRRLNRRTVSSPVAIAAVGAALAASVHSFVDFSLQFQAVGLTLAVLVGAGFGEVSEASRSTDAQAAAPTVPRGSTTVVTDLVEVAAPSIALESEGPVAEPYVPAGCRLYAFGDLHGRLDLLVRLRDAIRQDLERDAIEQPIVIGLGDYIDRGPQSKEVIEALASDFFPGKSVLLRGNHEQMLLDFLEDPIHRGPLWFRYGAPETLRSYGVDGARTPGSTSIDCKAVRDRLASQMPSSHVLLLQRLPTSYQNGSYFFAHAGARHSVPLDQQEPRDLLWIRKGFADRDAAFEKTVVHGHTPVDKPYFGQYRINIDTGAYLTNRLTCLVLEGDTHRLLEVSEDLLTSGSSQIIG
jgi:O-antigen ligase/diadenosine tetraphosphatase ApaH/serine/threonine PP2A family protein phosphatase